MKHELKWKTINQANAAEYVFKHWLDTKRINRFIKFFMDNYAEGVPTVAGRTLAQMLLEHRKPETTDWEIACLMGDLANVIYWTGRNQA